MNAYKTKLFRVLRILPFALNFCFIVLILLLILFKPRWFEYVYFSFLVYILIKNLQLSIGVAIGYLRYKRDVGKDWLLKSEDEVNYQILLIPFCDETFEVLDASLEYIRRSEYDLKKVVIILAVEEKGGDSAQQIVQKLKSKYRESFADIISYTHPKGLENEAEGVAGPNMTWAMKNFVKEYVKGSNKIEGEVDLDSGDDLLVTMLDSDMRLHPKFLAANESKFLEARDPDNAFVTTGLHVYSNNISELPLLPRAFYKFYTVGILQGLVTEKWKMGTWSVYSTSLRTIIDNGYWDTYTGIDDSLFYWKRVSTNKANFKVKPHYVPVWVSGAKGDSYLGHIKAIYKQQFRWAWGVVAIPLALVRMWSTKQNISRWLKVSIVLFDTYIWRFWLMWIGVVSLFYSTIYVPNNLNVLLFTALSIITVLTATVLLVVSKKFYKKARRSDEYVDKLVNTIDVLFFTISLFFFFLFPTLFAQAEMAFRDRVRQDYYISGK